MDKNGKGADLRVTATRYTRDMSVANTYSKEARVGCAELRVGMRIEVEYMDCGAVEVLAFSEEKVVLRWANEVYEVPRGGSVESPAVLMDNPYLSVDQVTMRFGYGQPPAGSAAVSIATRDAEEDLTGRSHWWGAPDLPEDLAYPCVTVDDGEGGRYDEPLTFVCQIRCADLAPLDEENLLPHRGMLYFFAPLDYFLGEHGSPLDHHVAPVVLYTEREEGLEPYDLHWEDTGESVFRPAEAMDFHRVEEARGDGHRLLGRPYQEEVEEAHRGCLSLLQIDEDDRWGLRFYDCGMHYFLLSEDDLRARRWDRVEGALFYY